MYRFTFLLILLIASFSSVISQSEPVSVYQNQRFGYINTKGELIIKPQFKEGADFSEGLARVRVGGLFGYINIQGNTLIKPVYDYATDFTNGIAKVYKNGAPVFINKEGKELFVAKGYEEGAISHNEKIIITKSKGKTGLYDLKTSKWLLPCTYGSIVYFGENLFLAHDSLLNYGGNKTLVDESGTIILKIGSEESASFDEAGFVNVTHSNKKKSFSKFYSSSGKLLYSFQSGPEVMFGNLRENRISITSNSYDDKGYCLYQNTKGKIAIRSKNFVFGTDFLNNRAFVQIENKSWRIIDTNGRYIGINEFDEVEEFFKLQGSNKIACIVHDENFNYGLIDGEGNYLIQPIYETLREVDIRKGIFLVEQSTKEKQDTDEELTEKKIITADSIAAILADSLNADSVQLSHELEKLMNSLEQKTELPKQGIVDYSGNIIIPIDYTALYPVSNDIIYFEKEKESGYINWQNKVIWKDDTTKQIKLDTLDISFMFRGYFYAASESEFIRNELGGWGHSDNKPKKANDANAPGISLSVETSVLDTFYKAYHGYKVFLSNPSTTDTAIFSAQDSRLYINMQAIDSAGDWRDIEYLPSSWCGNSYHSVGLLPQQKWEFTCPVYKGIIKTKLRLKCMQSREWNSKKQEYDAEKIIYSNEFEGSINPAQFWRKRTYSPNGIMDPYND